MNNPLVSICIPTYNGQEFLKQCLDSCLNQSYTSYEVLLCDDCSTDSTLAIAKDYASKYPQLKVLVNPQNLGLVGNWNKCLQEARGEWIKFVFQDDYITPNCLEKFVQAIEPNTRLIVSERHFLLPADASEDVKNYYANVVRTLSNTCNNSSLYYSPKQLSNAAVQNMAMNFIAEPSLSFFKKDILTNIGNFKSSLKQICDLEFILRAGTNFGLRLIPEKLCAFRIHSNTTTSTNISQNYFVLRHIEPLLLAYYLLYDEQFKNFRSHLSFLNGLKLKLYFKVKAYKAYQQNLLGQHQHPMFNEGGPDFMELRTIKKGNLLVKLISLLVK
ncbi:MAG: glycosyltransferase family 2 protein [Bacteroidia bacterium]|nr:glycosyltransferase family 2 protein [Bacteroidia bacterium]